jgi:TonB family protein
LLALAYVLLKTGRTRSWMFGKSGGMAALVASLVWTAPAAQAQFPDPDMLNTLGERLLTPSDAYPNAADIPSVLLRIDNRRMTIEADVHAAIRTAVPLPGNLPAWTPSAVFVDGKPEVSLRRDKNYLWIVVPEGVHKIRVEGVLSGADEWQWTFALKPRHVTIEAPEWTVSGVRSDGVPEQQIFFVRKDKSTAGQASYERQEFQTVAAVERNLQLGLVWQVQTTVSRLSPDGRAIAIRVPLLAGEKVLSANAVVRDGLVEVRLGANDGEFSWESELPVTSKIELKTKAGDPWVERWHVLVSPVWNLAISGLAPTFEPVTSQLVPVWQPWPGESTELTVSRPEAIAGATVTVDSAKHDITLGKRQRVSQLNLSVRSSLGEDFQVDLPAAADISSLSVQGKTIPVRKDGTKLIIPLQPGEQSISVGWKASSTLGFFSAAEEIKLPVASANIETTIHVPSDRWILWTHGPLRGPAVRFWSILVCALIAAERKRLGTLGKDVERALGKKPTDAPPAPRTTASPKAERQAPAASAANSGASAAALASYRQMVAAHLQRFKQYPPAAKSAGQQGTARVSFTLSRSGGVLSVSLGGSSGHSQLDAETLAMVRRAQPFPAFPADVKQSSMPFSAPVAFYIR